MTTKKHPPSLVALMSRRQLGKSQREIVRAVDTQLKIQKLVNSKAHLEALRSAMRAHPTPRFIDQYQAAEYQHSTLALETRAAVSRTPYKSTMRGGLWKEYNKKMGVRRPRPG